MNGEVRDLAGDASAEGLEEFRLLFDQLRGLPGAVRADELMLFETALMEIANNTVEHGRPRGRVHWHLVLRVDSDRIDATLSDDGEEIELPPDAPMPDPAELATSGRGLPLARALLDDLSLTRRDDRNIWRLTRRYSEE